MDARTSTPAASLASPLSRNTSASTSDARVASRAPPPSPPLLAYAEMAASRDCSASRRLPSPITSASPAISTAPA
eukprot:CAMPEP_0182874548 /NCGR_PEP_ID=MMETSP0034_2-20130328/13003_1 /TAXON_ID=156128 /ORGANISM="Nephroselmis pyriformis, Strain CCMP717" /LENGTH=74 /DNA_ID=CAMNT_0025007263 /DNA_START=398 /DNA_END=622 /DNA_ORIENTATION=+